MHTELGYLYITFIKKLDNEANKDIIKVIKGRFCKHLMLSQHYSAKTLLAAIGEDSDTLTYEKAILMVRRGNFAKCFDYCVKNDLSEEEMLEIAEFGLKWHQGSQLVYYNLFKSLLSTGRSSEAISLLSNHSENMPFSKIVKNLQDDEEMSEDLNNLMKKVFEAINQGQSEALTGKSLTASLKLKKVYQKYDFEN